MSVAEQTAALMTEEEREVCLWGLIWCDQRFTSGHALLVLTWSVLSVSSVQVKRWLAPTAFIGQICRTIQQTLPCCFLAAATGVMAIRRTLSLTEEEAALSESWWPQWGTTPPGSSSHRYVTFSPLVLYTCNILCFIPQTYFTVLPPSGWHSTTSVYMRLCLVTLNTTHRLALWSVNSDTTVVAWSCKLDSQ